MQYTRVYFDPATGDIRHVHTQDTPIVGEPVTDHGPALESRDVVVERAAGERIRARWLLENLEVRPDRTVGLKASVPAPMRRPVRPVAAPERV